LTASAADLYGEVMVVGVVGDTHLPRFGDRLPVALRDGLRAARVGLILHVGDFTGAAVPALFEAIAPLEAVAGNNDPPTLVAQYGRRKVVAVAGARIGLAHGHGRGGTTLSRSLAAFAGESLDVLCFGHSHHPLAERRGGLLLLNPGSPTDKRRESRYSYAILDIQRGRARARLLFFEDRR
jgi:putative phosphoesterase